MRETPTRTNPCAPQLRVIVSERDFSGPGTCILASKNISACRYFDERQAEVQACRLKLTFYGNITAPGERVPSALPTVDLIPPGPADGCTFKNCAAARSWANERVKEDRAECWSRKNAVSREFRLTNPAGNAKRNRIIFTVCAGVALLIVLAMCCVMCGMICRSCR